MSIYSRLSDVYAVLAERSYRGLRILGRRKVVVAGNADVLRNAVPGAYKLLYRRAGEKVAYADHRGDSGLGDLQDTFFSCPSPRNSRTSQQRDPPPDQALRGRQSTPACARW